MLLAAVVLLVVGAAASAAVRCEETSVGAGSRLAEIDGQERLAWIDARLADAGHQARVWTWGWSVGVGTSGLASLAVVPFVRRQDRVDWYTSAGSAAIGMIPFIFAPLDVTRDARELHAKIATGTAANRTHDVCRLLRDAETRMVRDAQDERLQQSWWIHVGNLAFNSGVALFLGLGFHHWTAGLINGVAGAAVGEAIILTQPTRTIDDLEAYRAGALVNASPL